MLGIVIGVSAVITMVTLGHGATQAVQMQISSLGTNLLMVRPGQRHGPGRSRRRADVQGIGCRGDTRRRSAASPRSRPKAAPASPWSATAATGPRSVTGSTNRWFTIGNWRLASGRMFSDDEQTAGGAVCIIGETVRREIFGGTRGLGEQLRIKQFSCEVIGVLASKGQAAMGNDQDDIVVVPLHTLQRRVTGNQRIGTLLVSMEDGTDPDAAQGSAAGSCCASAASSPRRTTTTSTCSTRSSSPRRCPARPR